jgi:hypothetical protein
MLETKIRIVTSTYECVFADVPLAPPTSRACATCRSASPQHYCTLIASTYWMLNSADTSSRAGLSL